MYKIISLFIALLFLSSTAFAEEKKKGKLDSFEAEVHEEEKESSSSGSSSSGSSTSAEGIAAKGIMDIMANFFVSGLANTGEYSSLSDMQKGLREMESPALPTIRIEPSYQYVFDGVSGIALDAELGYLMLGVNGEFLYYLERGNGDNLKFVSGHFLLRTLFAQIIEADMALGARGMMGNNSHTGFDLGFPFYIFFGKHFIWDVKPYITFLRGRDIYDVSSGLSYKYKMFGVRAAYRMINIQDETLHGPRIGVFFQW